MKKTHATGHTRKHTGTKKHAHTLKHHATHHRGGATAHGHKVHAKAKHATHAKARALAIGDALPVCTFEALAQSLRLAGQRVSDDDVAELWWLSGAGEDGASIGAALAAAARFGLAGCSPRSIAIPAHEERARPLFVVVAGQFPCRGDHDVVLEDAGQLPGDLRHVHQVADAVEVLAVERDCPHILADIHGRDIEEEPGRLGGAHEPLNSRRVFVQESRYVHVPVAHALILGVDLPGPHAVLATPDGWWSWGELHDPRDFPHAVVEEAWVISWA